jgi:hypothetical protein
MSSTIRGAPKGKRSSNRPPRAPFQLPQRLNYCLIRFLAAVKFSVVLAERGACFLFLLGSWCQGGAKRVLKGA